MITYNCPNCAFTFNQSDKFWDDAIRNARCPKCKTFDPKLDIEGKFDINTPKFSKAEIKLDRNVFYFRLIISILCWASSYVAIIASSHFLSDVFLLKKYRDIIFAVIFFYPWIALLVMNIGWVNNHRVHVLWPISGTVLAVLAILISMGSALLIAPLGILLAIWLVIYHLRFVA